MQKTMADGEDPGHGAPGGENPRFVEKEPVRGARAAAGAGDPVAERQPVRTGDPYWDRRLNEILEQAERDKPRLEAERLHRERVEREGREIVRMQQEEEERRFLAGLMTLDRPSREEERRGVRQVYPDFYQRVKARIEAKRRQDPQGGRRRKHKTRKHRKGRRHTRRR